MELKKTSQQKPLLNQAVNEISKHFIIGGTIACSFGLVWWKFDELYYHFQLERQRHSLSQMEPPSSFQSKAMLIGTLYSVNAISDYIFKKFFSDFSQNSNSYAKLVGRFLNNCACVYTAIFMVKGGFNSRDYDVMNAYTVAASLFNFNLASFKDSEESEQAKIEAVNDNITTDSSETYIITNNSSSNKTADKK